MTALDTLTQSTRNSTLFDLAALLKTQQDLKLDAIVPASTLWAKEGRWVVPGVSVFGDALCVPTAICDGQVADRLGIPVKYLRTLREKRIDLYDDNVNGWLGGSMDHAPDKRNFLVRMFSDPSGGTGIMRALLSDTYGIIDNLDVLFAVMEGITQSGVDAKFASADLSESRMTVRFEAPAIQALAPTLLAGYRSPYTGQTGDECPVVFAGFEVSNGELGGTAFTVTPRLTVEVCKNGMTMTKDALRQIHLGSKMDEGVVRWSEDTLRKNLELVQAQARDAVTTFLNVEYVAAKVAELEAKAGAPVSDAVKTIELVSTQLRYTEEAQAAILARFIEGGQLNAGGIMHAITAVAQDVMDPDVAFDLEHSAVAAMELVSA